MATFLTLTECQKVADALLSLGVQHRQKILKGRAVSHNYAILLLEEISLDAPEPVGHCPHCGSQLVEENYKWCAHCGDITLLDEYEDAANKAGWPG